MADEPKKIVVQASRIDASILPPGFSLAYRLYVIQQTDDLKSLADGANNASELAYEAAIKNEEQDQTLALHDAEINSLRTDVDGHESRITANTNAISLLVVRVGSTESAIVSLQSDITYLLNEVVSIESNAITKTAVTNQAVQSGGGSFIVGNVPSPTADKFQVSGGINVTGAYKVSGNQVVGARRAGWTAATGSANRAAFDANKLQALSPTYNSSEVNNIMGMLAEARQRIKALEDDLRAHGLIN